MNIDVATPLELTPEDVADWSRLQEETGLTNPFFTPAWVQACAQVDGPDRSQAKVAILRDRGEAIGFFPARVSRVTARPVGAPMCDYQGVIAKPGVSFCASELVRAFGVDRFDFSSLLQDQTPFQRFMHGHAHSQAIDLREGYQAYAAGRRAAGTDILQDTAKKRRKLEREHAEPAFVAASTCQASFDQLLNWKRAQYRSTGQTDIFEAGWPLRLLQTLFERQDQSFGGVLFTLHVGERLAASHFALRHRDVMHAWFIAHDETFARYSPGVILIDEILKWAPEHGVRELDLGPGDYRFKLSLANVKRAVADGYVGRPSPAALLRAVAYQMRSAAEAMPLGAVSELPGKAMRRMDLLSSLG